MSRKTRKPALPSAVTGPFKDAIEGLREQAMRWRGDTGALDDEVITKGELTDSGIGQYGPGGRGGPGQVIEPPDQTERRVGALTNLSAKGVFEIVILTWDGTNQSYYSFTEIWRASTDDIGQAVKRGAAIGTAEVFRDQADRGQTYYYWVRGVSTSGQVGPFNAVSGTKAHTSASPDAVRDAISSTKWQADTSYLPFAVIRPTSQEFKIDGVPVSFQAISGGTSGSSEPDWQASVANLGDTVSDGSVTWEAIDAGQAPLLIGTRNGNPVVVMPGIVVEDASIESAKIKELAANKILADKLSAISADLGDITGGQMDIGGSGGRFIVNSDGSVDIRNAVGYTQIRMNGSGNAEFSGDLVAATGTFSGKLTANAINAVKTINIADNVVTFPLSDNPADTTVKSFPADKDNEDFDENTSATKIAEISFNTDDLLSFRVISANFSAYRVFTIPNNASLSDYKYQYRRATKHEFSGDNGTEYAPARAYLRFELREEGAVVAYRWEILYQEQTKSINSMWQSTVAPNHNYDIQVYLACTGGYSNEREMHEINLSALFAVR
jgi:hypothetical protein